jgi:serpin B
VTEAVAADARLVLTNAIYFKGFWASQFSAKVTREAPFHVTAKREVAVPMMSQTETFGYLDGGDFQALDLPYRGGELSMVVLLPKAVDGLAALEKKFTPPAFDEWTRRMRHQEVETALPRFKVTAEFRLDGTLAEMGMQRAFSPTGADFSAMTGQRDLFISVVVHKAFVDVNEEGTEAAAATGVGMALTAMPAPAPVFRADHPFLFLIRHDRTGAILFMGRVVDPMR